MDRQVKIRDLQRGDVFDLEPVLKLKHRNARRSPQWATVETEVSPRDHWLCTEEYPAVGGVPLDMYVEVRNLAG